MTVLFITNFVFQVDSDLIFDSIEDTNNVYSHDRHQRDLSTSIEGESKSSHADENQHWFSGALHRIRRHIGSIFSATKPQEQKHKKRRTRQNEDSFFEQDQDDYEDEQVNVSLLLKFKQTLKHFSVGYCQLSGFSFQKKERSTVSKLNSVK